MKLKTLVILAVISGFASCKKDTAPVTQPSVFSFDFEGTHHSFALGQLQLQVIDTGASKGKYLSINTGNSAFPQVQFSLADRSNNYNANCFSTGPYPSLAGNAVCHDSVVSGFCVGFFMQYVDTGIGKVGLYAANDSVSLLTLITCSNGVNGAPTTINGTFSCVLTDSTGFISPKHVTNGQLSNITYLHN
jgi:hypothetical protein